MYSGEIMKQVAWSAMLLAGSAWGQLGQTGGQEFVQPIVCGNSQQLSVVAQGTRQIVAGLAETSIYICGFVLNAEGSTTVRLVEGRGTNCLTGRNNLTPAFKTTNGATVTLGGSVGQVLKLAAGNALCVTTTSNPDVGVLVIYTQR